MRAYAVGSFVLTYVIKTTTTTEREPKKGGQSFYTPIVCPWVHISGRIRLVFPFERLSLDKRSSVGLNFKPACRNGRFHPEKAPAFAPRCRGGGGRCSLCLPWLPGRARVCKLWGLPVPRCCLGPSRSVLSCTSPVQGGSRAFLTNATEVDCRTWPMGKAL